MREFRTTIDIDAPAATVWRILVEFDRWSAWNSVMLNPRGRIEAGAPVDFEVAAGSRRLKIAARMLGVEEGRDLRWKGPRSKVQARLLNGEHYFTVVELGPDRTRFIHGERWNGRLAGVVLGLAGDHLVRGYEKMNRELKRHAEAQ